MILRLWFLLLGLALAAYAVESTGALGSGLHEVFSAWVSNGIMLGAAAACIARGVLRARERAVWLVLGAGLVLWSGGDILWTVVWAQDAAPPYPSVADGLWLAFYPLCFLALALIVRSQRREGHVAGLWLDGVIAALAVAAFGAALVFQPVFETSEGATSAIVTNLAYPLGDIVLLALVAAVFGIGGWRPTRAWLLLGAGIALSAVADSVYLIQVANGSEASALVDPLWPAAGLLIALAAWQPRRSARVRTDGLRLMLAPVGFALAAIGLQASMFATGVKPAAAALALAAEVAVIMRAALTFRDNLRILDGVRHDSLTDQLTGLGNRRRLMAELDAAVADASPARPAVLALYDLDGFKRYNDTFGHPAGDALLTRVAERMALALGDRGRAYRMGGDEFCALVPGGADACELAAVAAIALAEHGEAFEVTCSHGSVLLPDEAQNGVLALQLADQRMYGEKGSRRTSPSRQSSDVLVQVLREREPELGAHLNEVGSLAAETARKLGIEGESLDEVVRAAELHDIGKMAVPDEILHKAGPLSEAEWAFMRQHTVIGERILARAPALLPVARLVRASHEHFDGNGYPDHLAGEAIPLGARVVAVCDAFHAMRSDRPYRAELTEDEALAELHRCAGTQFDPQVVDGFVAALGRVPAAT